MTLVERDGFMASLEAHYNNVTEGEGHCILLCGEAGIGKTALAKSFCKKLSGKCNIYQGNCEPLFTPRPLGPFYDILWQVNKERWPAPPSSKNPSLLFANFFQELSLMNGTHIIVFEDIHWADESTLDFIQFIVRRIHQLPCLFILTYRDNEIYSKHPLRNVLSQLPADSYTKLLLPPLSKQAVVEMATQRGYNGEDVYNISEGVPFYVNEILANYSPGIPDTIKDAILSVYERQREGTKNAWQIFSVIPGGLETDHFAKIRTWKDKEIDHCFAINVIIVQDGRVVFKHELYRRIIEETLTPLKRIELNKMMLDLFLESFEAKGEIERILHYARNANEKKLVVKYALLSAEKAAATGAHQEALKLYRTAIEYADENNAGLRIKILEDHAHACYHSNQIAEAINLIKKALSIRNEKNDVELSVGSLLFLSRLSRFNGNRKEAERYAWQSIELMNNQAASSTKAAAYCNMSQLKMYSDELEDCILWGERAMEMAGACQNYEAVAGALQSMGAIRLLSSSTMESGMDMLQQSIDLSNEYALYEPTACSYMHLGGCCIRAKKFDLAKTGIDEGISYCEEKNLHFWKNCLLSWKARLQLETGNWTDAWNIANNLINNEDQPPIIRMNALLVLTKLLARRGEVATEYLRDLITIAFEMKEPQWVVPSITALMEYEWITGTMIITDEEMEQASVIMYRSCVQPEKDECIFWMKKSGRYPAPDAAISADFDNNGQGNTSGAAVFGELSGRSYEQSLLLFEGGDENKRKAISMVQTLDAIAVCNRMKQEMRNAGISNIPRGIRNSTRSNIALLTTRELEILQLLKADMQNKEIANQLFISAKTVDHHISNILCKLDVNTRSKAVSEAIRVGILK